VTQPTRRIPDPGFAGDTGGADPTLAAALEAVAGDPGRTPEVLAALHGARVLAAVAAVATATGPGAGGHTSDKEADIALTLLDDRSGRRALPVFSSLATLARWDPRARPVPVEGPRAAAVAQAEGAHDLVVDLAGPVRVVLGEREVRALLRPVPTVPAYVDEELARALRAVLGHEPAVSAAWIGPGAGVDARLSLAVAADGDPAAVARSVAGRLAALARGSVLGLDLAAVPAGWAPPPGHRDLLAGPGGPGS
jgi:hypothetical protein